MNETEESWRYLHTMPVPIRDTQGNPHEVQYQESAETGLARYVHLQTCWCKQPQAAFS